MLEYSLFIIFSYFAAVAATLAGFGSSTLLIPVVIFFTDIKTGIFLVACFHLFNNLFKVQMFRSRIDVRLFVYFGIPSILFAFLGALFVSKIPLEEIKKILAVFLIGFSVFSFWGPQHKVIPNNRNALFGGGLSGFLAGLIGLGGAVRAMFLISFQLSKESYIATSALIALVVDLTRIPTYLFGKVVQDTDVYVMIPFLFVSAFLGVKTGKVFLTRIDQEFFRKIVLCMLFLVGIKLIF